MYVMKEAINPEDRRRMDQYERDVRMQLVAAEFAQRYNKQACPESRTQTLLRAACLRMYCPVSSVIFA
jgi:hypothetical protein